MYLERLIQNNYISRFGVKPSPEQTSAFVEAFARVHTLQEKIDNTADADFLAALKLGAQAPKKRSKNKPKAPKENAIN